MWNVKTLWLGIVVCGVVVCSFASAHGRRSNAEYFGNGSYWGDYRVMRGNIVVGRGVYRRAHRSAVLRHRHVQRFHGRHRDHGTDRADRGRGVGSGRITAIETAAGTIRVAARYAERFKGFIDALVEQGYKPKEIGCYAPRGHMRHSKHHWGGACDIDQTDRNVTAKAMYHVTELAHKFNLTDGCEWHDKDCGHVEVPSADTNHRSGRHRYAHVHSHRRHRYAAG